MLQRFIETFYPNASLMKVSKKQITENQKRYIEARKFEVPEGKSVYRLPISRFDWLNGNKRKYEKRLWQRVKESQRERYAGKIGLADHPPENSDGAFKESAIVWLDIELDESNKLIWGYGVPVGPYGKLFEEIVEAGGLPGFSSSGFGELDEDGETVKFDTYELERPADIVLTPSQDIYGDKTMKFQAPDGTIVQITQPSNSPEPAPENESGDPSVVININPNDGEIEEPEGEVEEPENKEPIGNCGGTPIGLQTGPRDGSGPGNVTVEPIDAPSEDEFIAISDIIKPVQVSSSKVPALPVTNSDREYSENKKRRETVNLSKYEQKKLEKDLVGFFEEAKQEKNPITKAGLLKEVYGFFDDINLTPALKEIKEAVATELNAVSKDIHTKIDESMKIEDEIGVKTVQDMKIGLDRLAEATFSFNEDAEHWKKVSEGLQKTVKNLKARLSVAPTVEEYEKIVQELEKTDRATRKIVEAQNTKIINLKKRLFEERNVSRKLEKEASELKVQLTANVKAKKRVTEVLKKYKEAYVKVIQRNKQLVADKNVMLEQVEGFLNGDMYRFGRNQKLAGSPADQIGQAVQFNESQYVESYYADLEQKYGELIIPYKERIIARKTIKGAIAEFTRIFAEIGSVRVPKGIDGDERKEFLEEAHNIKIKDPASKTKTAIRNILDGYQKIRPL